MKAPNDPFDSDFRGSVTMGLLGWLNQLKDQKLRMAISLGVQTTWRELKKMPAGPERARFVHSELDNEIKKTMTLKHDEISCRKFCTHCCYHEVMISDDEAQLMAQLAEEILSKDDLKRLRIQAAWPEGIQEWEKHTKTEKRCAFLDVKSKKCRIYNQRPGSCRKYFVTSPAANCADPKGYNTTLTVNHAEVLLSAAFNLPGDAGTIPKMVVKHLKDPK